MSLLRVASTSAVRITASTHRQLSSSAFRRAGAVSGGWGEAAPSGAALNSYVVLAEDHQDGGLARRLAVREQHLAEAKTGKQNGRVILGGGLLGADHSEIGSEGAAQHLKGSLLIVRGEVSFVSAVFLHFRLRDFDLCFCFPSLSLPFRSTHKVDRGRPCTPGTRRLCDEQRL